MKDRIICVGLLTAVALIFLFSTYPGIWINDDVATVLRQAQLKEWNDWHTFGYVLFVSLFSWNTGNGYPVNVIHTIIFLIIENYVIRELSSSKLSMYLYTLISMCVFTPFIYLEVMYKDTVYSMGILAMIAVLFCLMRKENADLYDVIIGIVGTVMTSMFRHGGFVIVLISLLIYICYMFIKRKKQIIKTVSVIVTFTIGLYVLVNVILFHAWNVEENPQYVSFTMPMQMVSAAAYQGIRFEESDIRRLEEAMPMEAWAGLYDKYWADSVSRPWCNPYIEKIASLVKDEGFGWFLVRLNAKLFFRNPVIYLKAFFNQGSILVEMMRPNDFPYNAPVKALCDVPENPQISYSPFYRITSLISKLTNYSPILNAVLWRGGFALWILFFIIVLLLLKREYCKIIPLSAIILNEILLALAIPSQDPRYILPLIEVITFIIPALLLDWRLSSSTDVSGLN